MTPKLKLPPRLNSSERLYQLSVPLIGLTGGIATGKSTVAKLLRQRGIEIIDADTLVKEAYQLPNVLSAIDQLCPGISQGGQVDFKKLRTLVFSDNLLKVNVEKIIYQELPKLFLAKVSAEANFIIYDVPLLFERGLDKLSDYSIVVYCPLEVQRQRLLARDEVTPEIAQKILDSQWPIEKKREAANFVIDNGGDIEQLEENVAGLLTQLFQAH